MTYHVIAAENRRLDANRFADKFEGHPQIAQISQMGCWSTVIARRTLFVVAYGKNGHSENLRNAICEYLRNLWMIPI